MTIHTKSTGSSGMDRKVQEAVTKFRAAKNEFVNAVQDILTQDAGAVGAGFEGLMQADALALLCCPLIQDPLLSVRIRAIQSLSNLASIDSDVATEVTRCGALDSVVISACNEHQRVAATAFDALASIARSSTAIAQDVAESSAIDAVKTQLKAGEAPVQISAVRAFNAIALSLGNGERIADEGILGQFVDHLRARPQKHSRELHASIADSIGTLASHTVKLAQQLVDCGALDGLMNLQLENAPPTTASAVFKGLCHLAHNGDSFATAIANNSSTVSHALKCSTNALQPRLRRNAVAMLHELAKFSPDIAKSIGCNGGVLCILKNAQLEAHNPNQLHSVLTLGYIAGSSLEMTPKIVKSGGCSSVIEALQNSDMEVKTAAAWAMEQLAGQATDAALSLAEQGAIIKLLEIYKSIKTKSLQNTQFKLAIKSIVQNCKESGHLQIHVCDAVPVDILKAVLKELLVLLPDSPTARRDFVASGSLMALQKMVATLDGRLQELGSKISELFPKDVVEYYS